MDGFHGFEEEAGFGSDEESDVERPPEIGTDERRMHVRAYNYWVSLLQGRPFPSITDVDPEGIEDFGPHSVLLDFSRDANDPRITYLGEALRRECGIEDDLQRISEVPARSLLSRLTDHYLQIIANRAPIGFEAEYVGQRGANMLYRGILMPLSSNGEEIDYIYGVINWKELADAGLADDLADEVDRAVAAAPALAAGAEGWADGPHAASDIWADGPQSALEEDLWSEPAASDEDEQAEAPDPSPDFWSEPAVAAEPSFADGPPEPENLADRLALARASAEEARATDMRSRASLYRALGQAHDFALAAGEDEDGYQGLLADAGVKAQARAPMTPLVKLVFGAGYDKSRLAEFSAALAWASREAVPAGELAGRLEAFRGGLKGVVQAERRARRPDRPADPWASIREQLLNAPPIARAELALPLEPGTLVLLVARAGHGHVEILAPVADPVLLEKAIRRIA